MSETEYKARLDLVKHDMEALSLLAQELDEIQAPWVRALQFRIGNARNKLRSTTSIALPNPVKPPEGHWLDRFHLPQPDGRNLYRYRLSKTIFEAIGEYLRSRAPVMRFHVVESDAALFVIWAAEWFRRVYQGGGEEWAKIGSEIGLSCDQLHWCKLADRGLEFWKIPKLKLNRRQLRLVSLARQGGFPLAAFREGNGNYEGWASDYLKRLVSALLSERFDDEDYALAQARVLSNVIPDTWLNEGMIEISAELAVGIVKLRRFAEAAGITDGTLAVTWLDTHHKHWRDDLPLSFEDEAAQALLGSLMRAQAIKSGSAAISASRLLVFENGQRLEKLELLLDGNLASDDPSLLKRLGVEFSRLRIYASGTLAQYVGGELGIAVADEDEPWVVRPSTSRKRYDVPFAVQAEIELRSGSSRVAGPFALPRGASVPSGLLILQQEGHGYIVKGTGSCSLRDDEIHLEMPESWAVELRGDEDELNACGITAGRQLVRVRGEAIVRAANGDKYLIRTGQDSEQRDRLIIVGKEPVACRSVDGNNTFCGIPQLLVGNDHSLRAGGNEVWWRHMSGRNWAPVTDSLPSGQLYFAWRHAETGHVRSTATAIILPSNFQISREVDGDHINLAVMGWPGHVTSNIGVPTAPNLWRIPIVPREHAMPLLTLEQNDQPALSLSIQLPQRAWIHSWEHGPVTRDKTISLDTLYRYVARSSRCELMADVYDRDGLPLTEAHASWTVEGELALSLIQDDIAALMRPLGDIGASLRLNFNDSFDNFWFVSEFEHQLVREPTALVPHPAIADEGVRVFARSLSNPAALPEDHGSYSLIGHRPIQLPHLYGDWLIYLKSGDRILSRPVPMRGTSLTIPPSTILAQAMAIPVRTERLAWMHTLADVISSDPVGCRAIIRQILDLALSLDGLPPATFDILALIGDHPLIGAMMAFAASESELETVMGLSDALPFAWSLIPPEVWKQAETAQAEAMFKALGPIDDASMLVAETIGRRRQQIASFDISLRPQLSLKTEPVILREAANSLITGAHEVVRAGKSPFRPNFTKELPNWDFSASFWRALDAPVAAAMAAKGLITLQSQHIRCIKDVSRAHPEWFAQGYTAIMREK